MPIIDFSLGGRLIDAVSETAYDLDGSAHTYDFTIMQIATVTAFDPFSIWPPAQPTIRILFDGAWPFLDVHIGDELVVEGPTVLIYTSPADTVPPLSRALRNTTQVMVSKIRWWIKHDGGGKKAAMTKLTDQFVAAKLSFHQWLQAQSKLFNDDLPPSLAKLHVQLTQLNDQRTALRVSYARPVAVFIENRQTSQIKPGPLPRKPVMSTPPGTVQRFDQKDLHQQFAAYRQEAKLWRDYTNRAVHDS